MSCFHLTYHDVPAFQVYGPDVAIQQAERSARVCVCMLVCAAAASVNGEAQLCLMTLSYFFL